MQRVRKKVALSNFSFFHTGSPSYIYGGGGRLFLQETLASLLHIEILYCDYIPESRDESEIIAPSHDILSVLDNLVQTGDVVSISAQATEIALLESGKYHSFAKKIEKLAEEFKLIEIEKNYCSL